MAKRKTSTSRAMVLSPSRPSTQTIVVRAPSAPAKSKRRAPLATYRPAKKAKKHRRSKGGSSSTHDLKELAGVAIAAGVVGMIEKQEFYAQIPSLPMIGKKGTLAVGAMLWKKYGGGGAIARDIALVATALAFYQLGAEGKISGEEF